MAEVIDELVVRITGDASELEAAINGATTSISRLENMQSRGMSGSDKAAKSAAVRWQNTGKSIKEAGEGINTITKPIQYAAAGLVAGGAAAAKFAIDFEDSFASVKKTVDGTPEQLAEIKKGIIDLSTTGIDGRNAIPLNTKELNELAAAGGQLGIQTENIVEFTEVMAQLETATNLVGEEGAATIARFQNVMDISQAEIRNVGSAIVDLGNNSATTESEIASMALRMGKYGNTVRMSAADVLGYSAALSSMGIEAQLGGSAVGRTWLSIESAVAHGGAELQAFAKYSNKSAKEFKEQWNTDSKGAFNGLLKGLKEADNLTLALEELGINNTQDIQTMQALVNGYDLVAKSVDRANTAYKENTALQKEFDAKAETTASQIQVTKNNLVEAARSIGETFLPTIKDVSAGVADFAKKLSSLDDGQKKMLINTAAKIVAIGASAKVVSSAAIGAGKTVEAIGKIRGAFSAGGALAKFAPTLTAIGSAAAPAALGIAGITTAVIVGKAAYDSYYNSNYKFADGLSETAKQLKSYKDKFQELNDLQQEYKDLSFKINSEEFSGEDLEYAKSRLEEIKNILKEKYKIDLDTDNLDEAVEKIKELEKLDFLNKKKELRDGIENLAPKYEKASSRLPQLEADYKSAKSAVKSYTDTLTNVAQWQEEYDKGIIDADTYTRKFTEALNNLGKECGKGDKYGKKLLDEFSGAVTGGLENPNFLSSWLQNQLSNFENELNIDGLKRKLDDAKAAIEEYKESVQTLAAIDLSELKSDFESGIINDTTSEAKINAIIEKLGTLDDGLQKLHQNEKIDIKFNLDSGGLDIFDLNGTKLGEVTAEGKINWKTGELPEIKDQDGKIIFYGDYSNLEAPTLSGTIIYNAVMTENDSLYNKFYAKKSWGKSNARGTMNFSGGLAKVNDDGKSDPRELIIDRGRAFIPEGRDVILPLSRGAKVYTSDQTKAIMRGIGIPHYAEGKNNSDAFTSARDDWTHHIKTHSVTTLQELEKWVELSKQFTSNQKDIWDIEEQVFFLQQKITKELNDQSKAYIEERSALNDWSEYGDNAIAAFERVRDRNRQEFDMGRLTWQEYNDNMSNIGSAMYSERVSQSEKWLTYEEKYNGMSTADYLAGIDRMRQYTEEYYAAGIISHREYIESKKGLNEHYIDKSRELLSEQFDTSKAYISEHTYFNDWGDMDDPLSAYDRVMARHSEALKADKITQAQYNEYAKELGSDMYSERREQSGKWLDEQEKYFGMEADAYIAGLQREKSYTEEYYRKRLIDRRTYNEGMTELNHAMWDKASGAYDDMLSQQQKYISDMQEQFSKQEQELRDSWTVEDRKADMAEVSAQLDIYEGAVTDRGQRKYKELQEQMKQLQRDEELYNLQAANNAAIEKLQADYEAAESLKTDFLRGIAKNVDIDVSGLVSDLTSKVSGTGDNITLLLGQLLTAFENFKIDAPSTTYADNRVVTVNNVTPNNIGNFMGGM